MKKTVFISGAKGLLGSKLAEKYSKDGWRVIGTDISSSSSKHFYEFYPVDFTGGCLEANIDTLIPIDWKEVDLLINCIGMTQLDWIENYTYSDFEKIYKVNVFAPFLLCKKFISSKPEDLKFNGGTICNIVSMGSKMAMRTSIGYCSTKAAYAMMTKQMSREVTGRKNIRIFGINPCGFTNGTKNIGGIIEDVIPQMLRTRPQQFPTEEAAKKYNIQSPTKCLLNVNDLVKFIKFMCEFDNIHMNGSVIDFWDAGA